MIPYSVFSKIPPPASWNITKVAMKNSYKYYKTFPQEYYR